MPMVTPYHVLNRLRAIILYGILLITFLIGPQPKNQLLFALFDDQKLRLLVQIVLY
jgi:hypothetical protein